MRTPSTVLLEILLVEGFADILGVCRISNLAWLKVSIDGYYQMIAVNAC